MSEYNFDSKLRGLAELDLRSLFIAAFFIGTASIAFTAWFKGSDVIRYLGVAFPAVVVVCYAFIGKNQAGEDRSQSIDQLADSSYYLGFLFTLVSLMVALANLSLSSAANEVHILTVLLSFALALITTIAGLISKILLTQFDTTLNHQRTRSMSDLTRATQQFSVKLSNSTRKVDNYLDSANAKIIATNEEAVKILTETSIKHSENLLESIKALDAQKEKSYESTVEMTESTLAIINQKLESYDKSLGTLFSSIDRIHNKFDEGSIVFSESLANFSGAITDCENSIKTTSNLYDEHNHQVNQLAECNKNIISVVADQIKAIDAMDEPKNIFSSVKNETHLIANEMSSLRGSVQTASTSIDEFSKSIPKVEVDKNIFSLLEESIYLHASSIRKIDSVAGQLVETVEAIKASTLPKKRPRGLFSFRK